MIIITLFLTVLQVWYLLTKTNMNQLKKILIKGLNEYRKKNNIQELKSKIIIGVLSFSSNNIIPTYSTDNEIKCFDFYYNYDDKIYINGKLV